MWQYNHTPDELYHFGIPGMKWGRRRYQNKDGTLTKEGLRRYEKFENKTNKEAARIAKKGITFDHKSKHRLKLEEKYKQMGLSDEKAQAAANNRIRTEKILAASAAMTVAACAAYYAHSRHKSKIDGLIKSGETLQRIEMQDTKGKLHDTFYVAKGKHDTNRYSGILGYTRQQQTGEAYKMKLEAVKDIKVASRDKAAKAFGELYKNDPEFKALSIKYVRENVQGRNSVGNIAKLSNRNIRKMYDNFNSNLIDARESGTGLDKKFYSKLKSMGYGAIQDINDMKFSGYGAKNPLIVFDNVGKKIVVKSVEKMSPSLKDALKESSRAAGENMVRSAMQKYGPLTAAGLATSSAVTYLSSPTNYGSTSKQKQRRR